MRIADADQIAALHDYRYHYQHGDQKYKNRKRPCMKSDIDRRGGAKAALHSAFLPNANLEMPNAIAAASACATIMTISSDAGAT